MSEKQKGVSPFARLRWPVSWHNGHFLSLSATTVEGTKNALQVGLAATMRRLHHLFCSLHSLPWHLWQRLRKKQKKKQTETPLPFFFLCRAALFEFSPYTEVGLSLSSIEMNSPLIVRKSAATADLEDMTAMRKTKKERKSCG